MSSLLAIPFEEFIPKILSSRISVSGQALIDWMNEKYPEIEKEVLDIYWFRLPERCPSDYLDELGHFLSADLKENDTVRQKRRKIQTAIATHKIRGSWTEDAKKRIDNIIGYNSVLYGKGISESDDTILLAYESDDPDTYWSTLQADEGSIGDDLLGAWLVGDFTEHVIAGNVYINCHEGVTTGVLTPDEVAKLVLELEDDVTPAYFIVYLGYEDSSGTFIKYNDGIIG
jgi:hypothetical protein